MKTLCDYVSQLESAGMAAHTAMRLCCDFLKNYSRKELENYIESIEADHVDKIQCQSNIK